MGGKKKKRFPQHFQKASKSGLGLSGRGKPPKKKSYTSPAFPRGASSSSAPGTKPKGQTGARPQPQHERRIIPFAPEENILLVGEGDLSFAACLVQHHGCENVTATVLEKDLDELAKKYPHVVDNVARVEAEGCRVLFGVDARRMAPFVHKSRPGPKDKNLDQDRNRAENQAGKENQRRPGIGLMDRIIFNFPHVGGKSTDVNRQVRYNQELLVDFFRRATPSLAPGGSIIVTLFEGEPYTLWNIRDLGRHAGLAVDRSFQFQAAAYPGYHHARTFGVVRNRRGEVGGGWKGEERPARSYIFVRKDDVPKPVPASKKRKRPVVEGGDWEGDGEEEEEEEEDEDDDEDEDGNRDRSGGDDDSSSSEEFF